MKVSNWRVAGGVAFEFGGRGMNETARAIADGDVNRRVEELVTRAASSVGAGIEGGENVVVVRMLSKGSRSGAAFMRGVTLTKRARI